MSFFMIIDPMYAGTYWCSQYVKGINYEAQQNNRIIHEIEATAIQQITEAKMSCGNIVILLSNSISWLQYMAEILSRHRARVVLISPLLNMTASNVSYVCADLHAMICSLCSYMVSHGKQRIALFGWLPDSTGDMVKRRAFEKCMRDRDTCKVFENNGDLEASCDTFYEVCEQYDAVLCCNDIAAIKLLTNLKKSGIKIPDDLWISAIGDTMISKLLQPSITTAVLDCLFIGRQTVKLCMMLAKTPTLTSLQATVSGFIDVRASTAFSVLDPFDETAKKDVQMEITADFYTDRIVQDIFCLEMLLSHCSAIDIKILQAIRAGMRYQEITETLFISESTIKYRLKRMRNLAKRETREEIMELVENYLDLDKLTLRCWLTK